MSERPDQWTRMRTSNETFILSVRINDVDADLVFTGRDLIHLAKHVTAAKEMARIAARKRRGSR